MIYLFLTILLLFVAVESWRARQAVSRLSRGWRKRKNQPLEEIYRTYYEKRGMDRQVIETVWQELALALETEPGRLRPNDRLDRLGKNCRLGKLTERVEEIMEHYLPYRALVVDFKTIDHLIVAICRNWNRQAWLLGEDLQTSV